MISTQSASSQVREQAAKPAVQKNAKRRITSIDLFRGALLCIMVLEHFLLYFGNESAMDNWFYSLINDGIAGWGAGGFLMMMGASQALSAERLNTDSMSLLKKALLRGTYLFVVGMIMLLISFGPGDLWRWDILTLMGVSTVLLFFCRSLSSWIIVVIVAAMVIAAPVLRGLPIMSFEWDVVMQETPFLKHLFPGMYWDPTSEPEFFWRFEHVIKGFFLWGEFPIFPWAVFPLLGLVFGRRIVQQKFKSDISKIVATGVVLIALSYVGAYLAKSKPPLCVMGDFIAPFCFYPDSFTMSVYQVGMTIVVFSLLFHLFDVKWKDSYTPGPVARILKRTSNFSLTFYFLHYMLLGWPLLIAHAITGQSQEMDFMGLLPALTCGIMALLALQLLIKHWEKYKGKYSLEWGLGALTKKVVKEYKREV